MLVSRAIDFVRLQILADVVLGHPRRPAARAVSLLGDLGPRISWPTSPRESPSSTKLAMAIMKDIYLIAKAEDPLLYVERRGYLMAMWSAVAGLESARVVLVKATHRLIHGQCTQ
jgi:hypothetical protein